MKQFTALAISDPNQFVFGASPYPLTLKSGLVIGGGEIYPELNFTLPGMAVLKENLPEIRGQYCQMIEETVKRAVELETPSLVVEFELLPEMTIEPEWGAEITAILRDALDRAQAAHGIKTGLRATPNDIREFVRPPQMRQGSYVESMFKSFERCAQAGADMLAIESTGGKELHDDALLQGDLAMSVFSLGVLGSRDMAFLWERIVAISDEHSVIPAGDSACGFANTAMVLAENRYIPRVWAAVVRVMSVARSLVAYEHGAIGPGKDCAYEGVFLKAITGYPISLEGAEAACAHLSPIGNITKAVPDLWSNESVQNVKLLGGMAPVVSLEQLVYATRLMNVASSRSRQSALTLRDWLVESDAGLDPQAYVLSPAVALHLADEIVAESTSYLRTRRAAIATLACLHAAAASGGIKLNQKELRWLDKLSAMADSLPADEGAFIASMRQRVDNSKVLLAAYGL